MKTVIVNAYDALVAFRDQYPTTTAAAQALGVSKQYLSDLLSERRELSPQMLKRLRLKVLIVKGAK